MNRNYYVDVVAGEIVITKNFAKAASKVGTKEFNEMVTLKKSYPEFTFKYKEIAKKADKVTYSGLTINKMRAFVKYVAGEAAFNGFDDVIEIYKGESGKYATIKKIFLARYGEDYTELQEDVEKMIEVDKIAKSFETKSNEEKMEETLETESNEEKNA